jgi:hypothetical protein
LPQQATGKQVLSGKVARQSVNAGQNGNDGLQGDIIHKGDP